MVKFIGKDNTIKTTLSPKSTKKTRICVISDTHETHHNLTRQIPPCDIVIHTGDIGMTLRYRSYHTCIRKLQEFNEWVGTLDTKKFILIAGNHDSILENLPKEEIQKILFNVEYLENSVLPFKNYIFIGCPFSFGVSGNNAFQSKEYKQESDIFMQNCAREYKDNIILLTHVYMDEYRSLLEPEIYISGHNHNTYGIKKAENTLTINATSVNLNYEQINEPIVFDIPLKVTEQQTHDTSSYELTSSISESI